MVISVSRPPELAHLTHVVEGDGHLGQNVGGVLEAGVAEPKVDLQGLLVLLQLQVGVRGKYVSECGQSFKKSIGRLDCEFLLVVEYMIKYLKRLLTIFQ